MKPSYTRARAWAEHIDDVARDCERCGSVIPAGDAVVRSSFAEDGCWCVVCAEAIRAENRAARLAAETAVSAPRAVRPAAPRNCRYFVTCGNALGAADVVCTTCKARFR